MGGEDCGGEVAEEGFGGGGVGGWCRGGGEGDVRVVEGEEGGVWGEERGEVGWEIEIWGRGGEEGVEGIYYE